MELPAEVVTEIQANRKVTAIKILRTRKGIGLKEAKDLVDAYIAKNPPSPHAGEQKSEGDFGLIIFLILGVGVIFAIYRYLTS